MNVSPRNRRFDLRGSIAVAFASVMLFASVGCEMNLGGPKVPVCCYMRDSVWGKGKVVIVENTSDNTINLWLYAHGRTSRFSVGPRGRNELGWLEGYEFGENSTVTIGGEGFAPESFSWSKTGS